MRLIDTETLALKEFSGNEIPHYAILSHTWEEEEVSFQDWSNRPAVSQKKGYKKILATCQLAKNHGYKYVWVDTNCIDKSSSAELTEAINSMFKWYQFARVCYVYLADVPPCEENEFSWYFNKSRWFTRGWTLQELLAPRDIEFYNQNWSFLGTKRSLCSNISSVTKINIKYLWGNKYLGGRYIANPEGNLVARSIQYVVPLQKASVSERLSWLSSRTTTRLEDMAYCALGIFDLNMPLLYGEGSKAFTRLQEEIMKVSDDHSLFCWTWNSSRNRGSFLSTAPSDFMQASRFAPKQEDKAPSPYTFTNAGLQIRLPILQGWQSSFIGILRVGSSNTSKTLGLPMSGDFRTGRVCRKPFPPEPIPLCDMINESQEFNLFVSENYSQQRDYDFTMQSSIPANKRRKNIPEESAILLTFGAKLNVRRIETYPPRRFDHKQSSVDIYSNKEPLGLHLLFSPSERKFKVSDNTYEGVLIQLELQNGEYESFMVASTYEKFPKDKDRIDPRWRWHCWPVSPEDASTIVEKRWEEVFYDSPVIEQAHMAMEDFDYGQILGRVYQSRISISIAKNHLLTANKAISHVHITSLSS